MEKRSRGLGTDGNKLEQNSKESPFSDASINHNYYYY